MRLWLLVSLAFLFVGCSSSVKVREPLPLFHPEYLETPTDERDPELEKNLRKLARLAKTVVSVKLEENSPGIDQRPVVMESSDPQLIADVRWAYVTVFTFVGT